MLTRQIKKTSRNFILSLNTIGGGLTHSKFLNGRREYSSLPNKKETSPVSTSEDAKQRAERKKVVDDGSFLALFRMAKQNFFMIKKHLSVGEMIMLALLGIPGVGVLYKYFYEIPNEGTKT